jgi:predicted nucleotidyltransferase
MTSSGGAVDDRLRRIARTTPGLRLLLVFGSRARDQATAASDWDLGYLAEAALDLAELIGRLVEALGLDRIDVVDLERASGLLRYRAARDGRMVYEAEPGIYDQFRLQAVRFWCDVEPVLRRAYRATLAELER